MELPVTTHPVRILSWIPAAVLLLPHTAAAATLSDSDCPEGTPAEDCIKDNLQVGKPFDTGALTNLGMDQIAGWLLSIAGSVAVLFIIWGGIKYISSGDDLERRAAARRTITYAIVGLVLALLSYVIVQQVLGFIYGVEATPAA